MFYFLVLFHFSFSDTWLFTFLPLPSFYVIFANRITPSWQGNSNAMALGQVSLSIFPWRMSILRVFITSVSSICLGIANIFKHIFKEMRKYCFVWRTCNETMKNRLYFFITILDALVLPWYDRQQAWRSR